MFFQLMIAMMLGLMSPSNTTCNTNSATTASTSSADDPTTGGDVGQLPPPR